MQSELLEKFDLKKFPYRINWEITEVCNFKCSYCINPKTISPNHAKTYSPEQIAAFFDKTGVSWLILITGGEPFTYPDFTGVCKALSEKHSLQITTNLSSPEIYRFADIIDPAKVFTISASYHYLERKKLGLIEDFVEKCNYLKNKGFSVLVNYIAHPETLTQMEEDLNMFKEQDIPTFTLLLRGDVNGKSYPESYCNYEQDLIKKYVLDSKIDFDSAFGRLNFYSHLCEAGKNYFFMDSFGNISQCSTIRNKMGNMFEADFFMNKNMTPCTAKNCNDVYCGIASVSSKKAGFIKMYSKRRLNNNI